MSGSDPVDPMKVLEQEFVASQQRTAEIAADMEALKKLKHIASKYGLAVVSDGGAKAFSGHSPPPHPTAIKKPLPSSVYMRAKAAGEAAIRAAGKPMQLSDVYDELMKQGVEIGGKTPKNTLSAYLGQNPNLISTPRGWWLKDVPVPARFTFARNQGQADHSEVSSSVINPPNRFFPKEGLK